MEAVKRTQNKGTKMIRHNASQDSC